MTIIELKRALVGFPAFSILDIRKVDPEFNNQRLSEWQEKGYLIKIIKGYYTFKETPINESFLYYVSNKVYKPSYISLESGLSLHNLIPEGVYTITAVTSQKTKDFQTPLGKFSYKSIREDLMFGYSIEKNLYNYKVAEPEKALLDYLYLNPRLDTKEALEELRLNIEVLQSIFTKENTKLHSYLQLYKNKSLTERVKKLIQVYIPVNQDLLHMLEKGNDA